MIAVNHPSRADQCLLSQSIESSIKKNVYHISRRITTMECVMKVRNTLKVHDLVILVARMLVEMRMSLYIYTCI